MPQLTSEHKNPIAYFMPGAVGEMIEAPKKKIVADTVIGHRYRICRRIGGGAMKDVYLAEDLRLARRHCALAEMIDSFINPTLRADAVKSFIREADILAELDHPHIPKIYDRFNENNHHFLVMEFVEGGNLEKRLCGRTQGSARQGLTSSRFFGPAME